MKLSQSSTMSSLTGSSQDLFRLEKTLGCLEECSFYYAEMDKAMAKEKLRQCRPVIVQTFISIYASIN